MAEGARDERVAPDATPEALPATGPVPRLVAALLTWGAIVAATPGVLFPSGSALLAVLGLVPWALVCSRPGRGAFAIEWLAGSFGLGALMWWTAYVWVPAPLVIGIGQGFYMAWSGVLLRRLARRWPLGLAAPAAWISVELVRALIPPPFGLGWQLLGHHLNDTPWLVESARLWGLHGLGWVLVAPAGLLAGLLIRRGGRPVSGPDQASRLALAAGLLPPLVGLLYGVATDPAPSVPGPTLLLMQPSFEQSRKQSTGTPAELFTASLKSTADALAERAASGALAPDLVVWGETMLYAQLYEPEVRQALAAGVQLPPWRPPLTPRVLEDLDMRERAWVGQALFGAIRGQGLLEPGTSFLSGTLVFVVRPEGIRRTNAIALYTEDGARRQTAGKVWLVPGAETMAGLEHLESVRSVIQDLADYVPDFVPGDRTRVLGLPWSGGERELRVGASVCFDNAFEGPYTVPLADEPLDFHLVVSNEAWYLDACEMDQMVAFSRVAAATSGRALVRAGNAGVTCVIGADGRELERLTVDGVDRLVPGHLFARVPIPADGDAAARPFYVRTRPGWLLLFMVLPLALLAGRRPRRA